MMQERVPLRMCAGYGEMKPKKELIQVVKALEVKGESGQVIGLDEISLDLTGREPGRGAYVCKDINCLRAIRKSKRFERMLPYPIPVEVYDRPEEKIGERKTRFSLFWASPGAQVGSVWVMMPWTEP